MDSTLTNFNSKICTVDTNILLRWLLGDNPDQFTIVDKILSSPVLKKCYVPQLVLAEIVWVMQSVYKLERSMVVEILEVLIDNQIFIFDRQVLVEALQIYLKKSSVSFIDCFLISQVKAQKTQPFLTFDINLQKINSENIY